MLCSPALRSAPSAVIPMLKLPHGLSFPDLYARDGLLCLDAAFLAHLTIADAGLCGQLRAAREQADVLTNKQESELLIALAPHLDDFIAQLFGIETEVRALSARHHELAPLYACKRLFVQRKALHKYKADAAAAFDGPALRAKLGPLLGIEFTELEFAQHVTQWQTDEAAHAAELDLALQYAAWAVQTPAGKAVHGK